MKAIRKKAIKKHGEPPGWVYFPHTYINFTPGFKWKNTHLKSDFSTIYTWRMTQGVYNFHPHIVHALSESKSIGLIPAESLLRIPEWCVYISTPDTFYPNHNDEIDRYLGFFANLDFDVNNKKYLMLRADVLFADGTRDLSLFPVKIEGMTIREAIEHSFEGHINLIEDNVIGGMGSVIDDESKKINSMLQLLLYICSDKPDIQPHSESMVRPRRGKPIQLAPNTEKFNPPDSPFIWSVGEEVAKKIASYNEVQNRRIINKRTSPKPHIRLGHYKHVWTGKKDGSEERVRVPRWIHPSLVNFDSEDIQ